jgi:CDP-diacylglycerol---serine O-phosphatidyltransferase
LALCGWPLGRRSIAAGAVPAPALAACDDVRTALRAAIGLPEATARGLSGNRPLLYPRRMDKPKPFSMIREFHLADWFTLANAFCGVGAIFSVMSYLQNGDTRHIYFSCALIVAALIFDVLDGRIARWRQRSSAMGRELDSLADIISFGVAPAAIAYGCGMQGLYDRVVLVFFVAAAWQGAIGEALWFDVVELGGFKLHPLVLMFAVSGSLMVSRIRIPKL